MVGVITGRWLETQRSGAIAISAKERFDRAMGEAQESKNRMMAEADLEIRSRREKAEIENSAREKRLSQREELLDQRTARLEHQQQLVEARQQEIDALAGQARMLRESQQAKLSEIAGLTKEEALRELLLRVEEENQAVVDREILLGEERARQEADSRARKLLVAVIQRQAPTVASSFSSTAVKLPSEEMKGRVIGREGRNIRLLESLTGVDIVIDDTPEVLTLSCFDPVRREVARMALQELIEDGRIQPARIEEAVAAAQVRMETRLIEEGERAAAEALVSGLHPELVKLLGRLHFRTSYSQNVLAHSVEVAQLAANLAADLGADQVTARRGGLLHDIGKAVSGEIPGPHALVGADFCRKYGESEAVCHAVEAHHEEVPQRSLEVVLVQSCDALSAARPGSRREDTSIYLKRLFDLEKLGRETPGVDNCYALQAGRELRVVVNAQEVDDAGCSRLGREIARKIQRELTFPGQIRVTVVRETRHEEIAR